jgi:NAD(P)-dependent dehydrogenase (short-subunit alcohol dehydrogenase family)
MAERNPTAIAGKVVLITGAGSGIGAASARLLHASGARLVLVDVAEAKLLALAAELGPDTLAVVASVTDRPALDLAVGRGVAQFGGIDIVFANAGIACDPPTTIRAIEESAFRQVLEVDLLGVWHTVRACLPQIVARNGYVLVTSSIYAFVNGMCNAPYAMSKAAVEMLGRTLLAELAGTGAAAGVLYPGWVSTPIARSALGGHAVAAELVGIGFPGPFGRPVTPERIAEAVLAGMARRASRIVCPRRWIPVSLLRGVVNPLTDWIADRHRRVHALVRQLD